MSNQLPWGVTQYICGNDKQSPSKSTAKKIFGNPWIWLAHPINIKGMLIFRSINENIRNGENIVTKCRVQEGSNELILAILPVPKKHNNVYNIYNLLFRMYKSNDNFNNSNEIMMIQKYIY